MTWSTRCQRSLLPSTIVGLVVGSAVGCGSEASLAVQLATLSGDSPFVGVSMLAVDVYGGDALLQAKEVPFDGTAVTLDPVPREADLRVTVLGLGADDSTVAQAAGAPTVPARGGSCCVTLCFCSEALFNAGSCLCGDDTCREVCNP